MALADINPLAPETLECPYPFYKALHEEAPVHRVPGMPMVIVSKYDLLQEIVHDPHTYSSQMPTGPMNLVRKREDIAPGVLALMDEQLAPVNTLLSADPPYHGRYRSIVNKAFAARRVAGMEGYVREIVTGLIDEIIDDGKAEFTSQFADRLPMNVIADQIGVGRHELTEFKRRSDVAIGGIDSRPDPSKELERLQAGIELQRFFIARAEERRREPRDDMLTVLATADFELDDGTTRPLNDAEILSILQQFQVAGKETTAHLLGSGMRLLCEHPDQARKLQEDPSLIANFAEEALRMESPVRALFRTTTKDVTLGGVELAKGTTLMLQFAAANRDEEIFACPADFDVTRENARSHMAFSAGPHYCVAAALARLEIRVAFEELLKRMKNIRLDPAYPPPTHQPSYILRGLNELHILFDKR